MYQKSRENTKKSQQKPLNAISKFEHISFILK
jgi:hypothetical protein